MNGGIVMYRIAVIQNEVEMQHSGYVDSVPKYRKQDFDLHEHVFNRFSSVNIGELFIEGENYILDYDCIIIGTNATSDGDVYSILCNDDNKRVLKKYIDMGKGLLICSQKKLKQDSNADKNEFKARKTCFLPDPYEYKVVSRPAQEGSDQGNIEVADQEPTAIQEFLCSYPQLIDNKIIQEHCMKNDFQQHFYRDYIIPLNDSSYFPVLLDKREIVRNTLMVARPRRNEKIVISTMALDWAGHYELIENILYYLIIGIPTVAFVDKEGAPIQDFKFLMSEAELSNISYIRYVSTKDVVSSNLRQYHTLYVFSPAYSEEEVSKFWETNVKKQDGYTKLFYYKYIGAELVLVNFSYFSYIDTQKCEVETWLKSEYKDGLWGNSFWKTYDALFALYRMGEDISPYLKGAFSKIEMHYRHGSYDGVLAPTCGLFEIEALVMQDESLRREVPQIENYFKETQSWLSGKYNGTSCYNKKFIVRSFYNANYLDSFSQSRPSFENELFRVATDGSIKDKLEIDLCLDVEVCLIYLKIFRDKKEIKVRINECIENILDTQMQNGRWDNNLGKTARLLVFFIAHQSQNEFKKKEKEIKEAISRGITALRNSYQENNWENNIVTTANAITAIASYEQIATYKSKDFLNQVNKEAKLTDSYNSLILALNTIDVLTKKYGKAEVELRKLQNVSQRFEISQKRLRTMTSVAIVSVLLVLSYYLFLWLKDIELFKSMMLESFMWIPIVVGAAITGLIEFVPKIVTKSGKKKAKV